MRNNYPLTDTDLTGLWLQPGFVEGIVADHKRFGTLEGAYRHIFRRNLEYAILLWNGLPVRFSYREDLPAMAGMLITMLEDVQRPRTMSVASYEFKTPNIQAVWRLGAETALVTIDGYWQKVPGDYEVALNHLRTVRMFKETFLCEWKLLLQQFIQALADAGAFLTEPETRLQLQRLSDLETGIPQRGRFYQYEG